MGGHNLQFVFVSMSIKQLNTMYLLEINLRNKISTLYKLFDVLKAGNYILKSRVIV